MAKRTKIIWLILILIAIFSIGFGILKIYVHSNSVWKYQPLDYVVGLGAIAGGLFLLLPKISVAFVAISCVLIGFEVFKLIVDFHDLSDVRLCAAAIISLGISVYRHSASIRN